MTSTDVSSDTSAQTSGAGTADMMLEVVTVPVSDADRAKRFYQGLGWRLDADLPVGDAFRVVQFTPTHSACSVSFGKGLTTGEPGSVPRLLVAVSDIDAARADLVDRGVEVSEVFHPAGGWFRARIRKAALTRAMPRSATRTATGGGSRRSRHGSPAGNGRTPRRMSPPGQACSMRRPSITTRTRRPHAPHDWWDWYAAAYLDAREHGSTPEEASAAASRYMAEVKHVAAL